MNITDNDVKNIKEYFLTLNNQPLNSDDFTLSREVLYWFPPAYKLTDGIGINTLQDLPLSWFIKMKTLLQYGEWYVCERVYNHEVKTLTERQDLSSLKNIKLRGSNWHLDHIVPICKGGKYKIPPAMIANIANLKIMSTAENKNKSGNNISKNEKNKLDERLKSIKKPISTEKILGKK